MSYLLIVLASLFSCGGQLCQKQATWRTGRRHLLGWLALSVVLLGCAMLLWLLVLQRIPVGVAYPMLSLNFIFITLSAHLLWGEPVSRRHWLGVGLIILGISVLGSAA